MSEHEWKPGAVVMWCPPMGIPQVLFRDGYNEMWISEDEGQCVVMPEDSLRPIVVIDPESNDDAERLIEVMKRRGWSGLNDDAVSDMRNVLADLANPTPEPLPEPTDPAVRVVDAEDHIAARIGDEWVSSQWGPICWEQAWHEHGPLIVQTDPDAPNAADVQAEADDDRLLEVGDRVRVSKDATYRNVVGGHVPVVPDAHLPGRSVYLVDGRDGNIVLDNGCLVREDCLTRIGIGSGA